MPGRCGIHEPEAQEGRLAGGAKFEVTNGAEVGAQRDSLGAGVDGTEACPAELRAPHTQSSYQGQRGTLRWGEAGSQRPRATMAFSELETNKHPLHTEIHA